MGENLKERIENDFTYHRPPSEVVGDFVKIREKAKELALMIADLTPRGREQSTALTRLEESVMHANAGIARQYPADAKWPSSTRSSSWIKGPRSTESRKTERKRG